MKQKAIVLCTGGYDPLHSGHIAYFREAKKLGDMLVIGVNSDDWLTRKKGHPFMPIDERINIIENLKMVDHAILFDDSDGSARRAILNVRMMYPNDKIIFANGGDRTKENIPEMDINDDNLEFVFGVGGTHKMNSSSWILSKALETQNAKTTKTRWGKYTVFLDEKKCKLKELVVSPGGCLSYQAHEKRGELWFVKSGFGKVIINRSNPYVTTGDFISRIKEGNIIDIHPMEWHQLINDSKVHDLSIIEIQYGQECVEEDIKNREGAINDENG